MLQHQPRTPEDNRDEAPATASSRGEVELTTEEKETVLFPKQGSALAELGGDTPPRDRGESQPLGADGAPFSGLAADKLWSKSITEGYSSRTWLSYEEAKERGGHVRRGETGTRIPTDADGKTKVVFNTDQCDGLAQGQHRGTQVGPAPNDSVCKIREGRSASGRKGIEVEFQGGRASPGIDHRLATAGFKFSEHRGYYYAFHSPEREAFAAALREEVGNE